MSDTKYIYARSSDQSVWRISFDDVVADMRKHNDKEDKWPEPISEEHALNWLGDNAEDVPGWEFVSMLTPAITNLTFMMEKWTTKEYEELPNG